MKAISLKTQSALQVQQDLPANLILCAKLEFVKKGLNQSFFLLFRYRNRRLYCKQLLLKGRGDGFKISSYSSL